MEFFEFSNVITTADGIRKILTVDRLPEFCVEIESIDESEGSGRVIYFRQWGRYHIRCDEVMGGVRFWIPDCPNALAWTITTGYPPYPNQIVLHATFNRPTHSEEFIHATKALLMACKKGLMKYPEDVWPKPSKTEVLPGEFRRK